MCSNIEKSDYIDKIDMSNMSPRPFSEARTQIWRITMNEGGSEHNNGIIEVNLQIQSKHTYSRLFRCQFLEESHEILEEVSSV